MDSSSDESFRKVGLSPSSQAGFRNGNASKEKTIVTSKGVTVLVPQPSDDPKDPLNWPMRKKILILCAVSLAAFAGEASHTANLSAYVVQAASYDLSPTYLLYGIAASSAGTVVGPFVAIPLGHLFGRSSTIFWALIGILISQIWAAKMTNVDDYLPFVFSRMCAGLCALTPAVQGSGYIVDMLFLHQRGRAFACFQTFVLIGVIGSSTIGGFIVNYHPWPYVFWWTLGPLCAAIIMVFLFIEETTFSREGHTSYPILPTNWIADRIATFLPDSKTVNPITVKQFGNLVATPFIIAATPVTIAIGSYLFFTFGFSIVVITMLTIYLQTPESEGGYGFTPERNAAFTFIIWVSQFSAQAVGIFTADAIPLWVTRKYGRGIWRPEYRLSNLWMPVLILAAGLGIFGAGIQYHLHYMILGLGLFLVGFSAQFNVGVTYNYIVECFRDHATEATVALSGYRLIFGVAALFFVVPWSQAVSPGWLYGMMAFFTLVCGAGMLVMALQGHQLRKYNWSPEISVSEDNQELVKEERKSEKDIPGA